MTDSASVPANGLQVAEIRERLAAVNVMGDRAFSSTAKTFALVQDITALLAEVERLREALKSAPAPSAIFRGSSAYEGWWRRALNALEGGGG